MNSSITELDSTAAVASVVGELSQSHRVQLDDFRLVPQGVIVEKEAVLRDKRAGLLEKGLELASTRSQLEVEVEAVGEHLTKLEAEAPAASPAEVAAVRSERDVKAREIAQVVARSGAIDVLVKEIDGFLTAIHTTGDGKRSHYVAAALQEQLHEGSPQIPQVLFIKAMSSSTDQAYTDRPFRKDKFSSLSSVSISYWLVDTASSTVRAAGVVVGSARVRGTVGENIWAEVVTESPTSPP